MNRDHDSAPQAVVRRGVGARGPQEDIDFTTAAVQLHKHSHAARQQPMATKRKNS